MYLDIFGWKLLKIFRLISVETIFANVVIDAELSGASVLNWKGDAQLGSITSTGASVINRIEIP